MFPDDKDEEEDVFRPSKRHEGPIDRFEGEMLNGYRHGNGILHLANGDVYQGLCHEALMHGMGTMLYASPPYLQYTRYDGTWVECQRNGHGRWSTSDGTAFIEGLHRRGVACGPQTDQTGTVTHNPLITDFDGRQYAHCSSTLVPNGNAGAIRSWTKRAYGLTWE